TINLFNEAKNPEVFLHTNNLMPNALKIFSDFALVVFPILGIAFFSSLIISYLQVGVLFTTKTLKIKLNRLNPVEGFKRIFSKRALMELFKSVFKIFLVAYVALSYIRKNLLTILQYPQLELKDSMFKFSNLTYNVIIRVLGILFVLAILDY